MVIPDGHDNGFEPARERAVSMRLAGVDLGKVTCRLVIAERMDDGAVRVTHSEHREHEGAPLDVFTAWYREHDLGLCVALAATGLYANQLRAPVIVLPEDACLEASIAARDDLPVTLNVLSIGGRGYGALARDMGPDGRPRVRTIENDKCSSGTGENITKIAGRFGLSAAEADALARGASEDVPITARCSVFAKTEMTHYANQGRATDALFRGFFASIADNCLGLLEKIRVAGPVYVTGGGARFGSVIDRLRQASSGQGVDTDVVVLEPCLMQEALGAVELLAQMAIGSDNALPSRGDALLRDRGQRFTDCGSASGSTAQVTFQDPAPAAEGPYDAPCVLGLDLGSTGAKAVLTSIATCEPLLSRYDRTRGNPIDAAQRLLRAILSGGQPDVRAVGVTGSGREAVATMLRAAFEPAGATAPTRVIVLNEIVAHATAARRRDSDRGADLSVIEIGGQDAKYIKLVGGRIVESDMNRACSAGTGSFLEEQAGCYGIDDIEVFNRMAAAAERVPDLGQMCTVYVADAGADAIRDGFTVGEVFAGFQRSVIHNYLDRVLGQRTLGKRVFFQGKPATSPSLARTLAAITGREIVVPAEPGEMGAFGIGLCSIDTLGAETMAALPALDLEVVIDAGIDKREEFRCRDSACRTLCPIQRTTVRIGDQKRIAVSGGACPKFEVGTTAMPKLERDAPDAFAERGTLFAPFLVPRRGRDHDNGASTASQRIAIPMTGAIFTYLPWLVTFLRELGYDPEVLTSGKGTLRRGEQLCNSFDACSPTKIAHGLCDTDASLIFFPKIIEIADPNGDGTFAGQTCVTEQAMPELVEQALRSSGRDTRVLRPVLTFAADGPDRTLLAALTPLADRLGAGAAAITDAAATATRVQHAHERALLEAGERTLSYAAAHDLPVVLVCGPLHVIHEPAINATIPTILRGNGALALPVDCYPLRRGALLDDAAAAAPTFRQVYWAEPNRYLRAAYTSKVRGEAYPLLLSSFGCGPGSFTEQFFQALLGDHPHTILESDGHGGTAGFVTRIQAFLQSVSQYRAAPAPGTDDDSLPAATERAAPARGAPGVVEFLDGEPDGQRYLDRGAHYVFLSGPDRLGAMFAAIYRSHGYDAVAAPALSPDNYTEGRRDCSGKECMSYQLVWGAFKEHLQRHPPKPNTRLVQVSGQMCRAGAFSVKDKLTLDRMGLAGRVSVTGARMAGSALMSTKLWLGVVALDVVRQLYLYHLAVEPRAGAARALYDAAGDALLELFGRATGSPISTGAGWLALDRLIERTALRFAELADAGEGHGRLTSNLRVVYLSGDLMAKGNEMANSDLPKALADHGIRIVGEPTGDYLEFLARLHPHLLFGDASHPLINRLQVHAMVALRRRLYRTAQAHHPWLEVPDLPRALEAAAPIVDLRTNGSATYTVGNVLAEWATGHVDGAVLTACWGCDNGLITESLLRHHREIPMLFHYTDGSPTDERRILGFAHRLRAHPTTPAGRPTARRVARAAIEEPAPRPRGNAGLQACDPGPG